MRGKRSKQYRKLMNQYGLTFNFREPYQILVDAPMVLDTQKYKMDLAPALSRTVHGKIKPMITQCSMRHLYADSASQSQQAAISIAKEFERRRCNHHTLPEPLSTMECWKDVIDPKGAGVNKHRYVVATQDPEIRAWLRKIPGVPLIYVHRSVMILEPMAESTESARVKEERDKFRAGVVRPKSGSSNLGKRKRESATGLEGEEGGPVMGAEQLKDRDREDGFIDEGEEVEVRKKLARKGPKAPNPLSVRKKKEVKAREPRQQREPPDMDGSGGISGAQQNGEGDAAKRKRRRKPSSQKPGENADVKPED